MSKKPAVAKAYAESTDATRAMHLTGDTQDARPASLPATPPRRRPRFMARESHGLMDPPKISLTIKRLIFGKCLFVRLFARAAAPGRSRRSGWRRRVAVLDLGAAGMCSGAREDKFRGISGENQRFPKGSNDGRCDRWRIFASLCVTRVYRCYKSDALWRILSTRTPPGNRVQRPGIRRNSENLPARHSEKFAKRLKKRRNSFSLLWARSSPQA